MEKKLVIYLLGFICGFMAMLSCMLILNSQEIFISWDIFIPMFLALGILFLVLKKKYLDEESLSIMDEDEDGEFSLVFFEKTPDYQSANSFIENNKFFSELARSHIEIEDFSSKKSEKKDYVIIFSPKEKDFFIKEAEDFGLSKGFKKVFWPDLVAVNLEDFSTLCPGVENIFASGTEFFEHGGKMSVYKKKDGTISAFFKDGMFESDYALLMEVEKQKTPIISVDI